MKTSQARRSSAIKYYLLILLPAMLMTVHAGNTWQAEPSLNSARNQFAGGVIDGKIFVFGGNGNPDSVDLKSVEMYDPAVGAWVYKADNEHNGGQGVEEVSGAVMNGNLYVFGAHGGGDVNFVEEFNPATNVWTSKAPRPIIRSEPAAVTYNNKIYLFDEPGMNTSTTNEVAAYDPASNTWQTVTQMPETIDAFAVAVVADKAYVMGGINFTTGRILDDVSVYNFTTGTWTTGFAKLPAPRVFYRSAAPVLNGKIYLVSPVTGTTFDDVQVSSSLDIYDPVANTWQTGTPLPTPTFGLSVIANNKLYVIGGDDESDGLFDDNEVITDKVWSLDLAEPAPHLSQVVITPAVGITPPSFTGVVTGGSPNGTAWLQASVDVGITDPWSNIAETALDNLGTATFTNIADTRPQAATAQQNFFRVVAEAAPAVPDGFARIPAGDFTMGQDGIATPVHTVYVSEFYMAKYETTKELWDEVRSWGLTHGYTDLAVGNGVYASKGANHPVHSITWYDMVKWCNARSEKENLTPCYTVSGATYQTGQNSAVVCNFGASGYRLPTEAEWEKAARGGVSGKLFPWGTDTITHNQANYYSSASYAYDVSVTRGNHPTYAVGDYPYSSPVGSFAPDPVYGLYDMAGNMWERCWDWYGSAYYSDPSAGTNPQGPPTGSRRVLRGGGWGNGAGYARCAYRNSGSSPTDADGLLGFRLARGQP